ncbi:hypothetical protein TNCV_809531 [Trichonephila clavipes]|uniref:Transposase n=1 Tax=Trichonephila clavipes TaxID=2585209 RepID=A0A8X6SC31_TRICX|nr:hypothetical protein TNCV_809531 [Trichonephila clavipes]
MPFNHTTWPTFDILRDEYPPTWAGVEPATLDAEGLRKPTTLLRWLWGILLTIIAHPKPDSGRSRHISRREDRHVVRNARVQPNASSAAIQAQVEPSLGAPVSSRTIRRCWLKDI